jgi:hypothetical protein
MLWVGFEPTIPAFERAVTVHALGRPHTNCAKTSIKTWDKRDKSWRQHHDSDRCATVFIISFVSTVLLSLRHVADIVSWRMPVCDLPNSLVQWWVLVVAVLYYEITGDVPTYVLIHGFGYSDYVMGWKTQEFGFDPRQGQETSPQRPRFLLGAFSPWVKQLGCEVDQSPPFSAEIELHLPSPHKSS